MPRRAKGARLYLRKRSGRPSVWCIRDGTTEISSGCHEGAREEAESIFAEYLQDKHRAQPPRTGDLAQLTVAACADAYDMNHGPTTHRPDVITFTSRNLKVWWQDKTLSEINEGTCKAYVRWRTSQFLGSYKSAHKDRRKVSVATARRDLETMRAAIGWYDGNVERLDRIPPVWLPEKSPSRERWFTRQEAARALKALRRGNPETGLNAHKRRHLARFFLIGLYTGTRHQAILKLQWEPNPAGGHIDLANGVMYRKPGGATQTKKRARPVRIPRRLLPHLRRWHEADKQTGFAYLVNYQGKPIQKARKAWNNAMNQAGLEGVTPHIMRHTAATWRMQLGVDKWQTAGFLDMSLETLERVYGHHHPEHQRSAADAY